MILSDAIILDIEEARQLSYIIRDVVCSKKLSKRLSVQEKLLIEHLENAISRIDQRDSEINQISDIKSDLQSIKSTVEHIVAGI